MSVIGTRARVLDADDRVRGRLVMVSDFPREGGLIGRILRSPVPHARLVGVDVTEAMAVPGVVAIVSGADVPTRDGQPVKFGLEARDTPVLAGDRVRYVGEPIAAVAAVDADAAEEALGRIEVHFEPLDAFWTIEQSLENRAQSLAIHAGGNVAGDMRLAEGDVDAAFARSHRVVSEEFYLPPIQGVPLEPHAVVADWNSGDVIIRSATQTPFHVRADIATIFEVEPERVRVQTASLGGGFGAKAYSRIEPLAVLLSKHAGRAVRIVLSRAEEFATVHRQGARVRITSGIAADGQILAIRADAVFSAGAYLDNLPRVLGAGLYGIVGPYRVRDFDIRMRGVYTNTVPCGPLRAPGAAQVQWAREAHIDTLALAIGMEPVAMRRRNMVDSTDRFVLGGPMGPVHLDALLDDVHQDVENNVAVPGSRRRAVGYAITMKTTWTPSTSNANVSVDDAGVVTVSASTVEMGQGARTVLAQIAAAGLGVSVEQVRVLYPDTSVTPLDTATTSSRSTYSMGSAVAQAAAAVKDVLANVASECLEIAAADIVFRDGRLGPVGSPTASMSISEAVRASGKSTVSAHASFTNEAMRDPTTGERGVSSQHHQAAASAIVEVDTETGAVELIDVRVATHAGRVINPTLAELQSDSNLVFGIGQALMEEITYDGGQLQNPSLADYMIPSPSDMPKVSTAILVEDDSGEVHGIGESALPAVLPALTNAVSRAIDTRLNRIPATPEVVLQSLRRARDADPTRS